MANYELSLKAASDLENILFYTKNKHGERQTQQYVDQLKGRLLMLAQNPHLAPLDERFHPPVHIFPSGEHLIVYVENDSGIWIVRILYKRMDIQRHL